MAVAGYGARWAGGVWRQRLIWVGLLLWAPAVLAADPVAPGQPGEVATVITATPAEPGATPAGQVPTVESIPDAQAGGIEAPGSDPAAPPTGLAQPAIAEPADPPVPELEPIVLPGGGQCQEQPPQQKLMRGNYVGRGGMTPAQLRERDQAHREAIRYRTEHYGYFKGFGSPKLNPRTPTQLAAPTTFFGLPVRLNQRIVPAVQCVEQELRRSCQATPYKPHLLNGIRINNSMMNNEASNHVFGIALDIDSDRNPCCGCGGKLRNHPGCRKQARSTYERMAMPACWVQVFERYGFYWLGHDPLRDTMHFEFLGDPERILRQPGEPALAGGPGGPAAATTVQATVAGPATVVEPTTPVAVPSSPLPMPAAATTAPAATVPSGPAATGAPVQPPTPPGPAAPSAPPPAVDPRGATPAPALPASAAL